MIIKNNAITIAFFLLNIFFFIHDIAISLGSLWQEGEGRTAITTAIRKKGLYKSFQPFSGRLNRCKYNIYMYMHTRFT